MWVLNAMNRVTTDTNGAISHFIPTPLIHGNRPAMNVNLYADHT